MPDLNQTILLAKRFDAPYLAAGTNLALRNSPELRP